MTQWTKRPIGTLRTNPDNPRIVKDDRFKRLVESVRKFPQMLELRPVVIDADGMILGGNMRFRACQEAGLTDIPVVCADTLTPEQKREFVIRDNANYGEWNWDFLANEWNANELADWGVDVPWTADEVQFPTLDTTEEKSFEQMTFTFSIEQAATIRAAISAAKNIGPFIDTGNENTNGNALARIAEIALGAIR